ncbi:VOC family protein [Tessaracoccus massiliensis]|uniref:VOC family protein n=1 Tax=Tessaracoccus massiliensis TaxID=1522311 RepID=UPI00058DC3E8|nr:VOC family protein [Tessaracoccus massiliensis]
MSLAPETHMGTLELRVRDMGTMLSYYTDGIGLVPLSDEPGAAVLGLGDTPVVRLSEAKELRAAPRSAAGLFHTAVVFDDLPDLARTLVSMYTKYPETFAGTGDHLVSQAFYFTDPEGNGVELYHDRPRDQWQWTNGQVQMDTLHIDPEQFIRTHLTEQPASQAGSLGHVHLQVGDIASAQQFYVDALGFDQTFAMPTALFVSAGGYHHHMAMNVWNSAGAGPRTSALGMGVVDIVVPTADEIAAADERLRSAGFRPAHDGRTLTVLDPWRNEIRLSPAAD